MVRTGDQRRPDLCRCHLGQDIPSTFCASLPPYREPAAGPAGGTQRRIAKGAAGPPKSPKAARCRRLTGRLAAAGSGSGAVRSGPCRDSSGPAILRPGAGSATRAGACRQDLAAAATAQAGPGPRHTPGPVLTSDSDCPCATGACHEHMQFDLHRPRPWRATAAFKSTGLCPRAAGRTTQDATARGRPCQGQINRVHDPQAAGGGASRRFAPAAEPLPAAPESGAESLCEATLPVHRAVHRAGGESIDRMGMGACRPAEGGCPAHGIGFWRCVVQICIAQRGRVGSGAWTVAGHEKVISKMV